MASGVAKPDPRDKNIKAPRRFFGAPLKRWLAKPAQDPESRFSGRGAGATPHFNELCITNSLTKQILDIFYGQLLEQTRIGCDNVGDQLPFAVLQL